MNINNLDRCFSCKRLLFKYEYINTNGEKSFILRCICRDYYNKKKNANKKKNEKKS